MTWSTDEHALDMHSILCHYQSKLTVSTMASNDTGSSDGSRRSSRLNGDAPVTITKRAPMKSLRRIQYCRIGLFQATWCAMGVRSTRTVQLVRRALVLIERRHTHTPDFNANSLGRSTLTTLIRDMIWVVVGWRKFKTTSVNILTATYAESFSLLPHILRQSGP